MDWKEQLNKAAAALTHAAESDTVKGITTRAREAASGLAKRVRQGALSAADAYVEANTDPATLRIRYLNADISILSPSDGLQVARPNAGALVISDGAGNGLVVSVSGEPARVAETAGVVKILNATTYDLGPEDGVNVIVLKA
ncbi:MAG: hypothetical protein MUF10_00070 [Thermoanaerobaculaceae bacterium]|jgi:hypothetical protein|nr:hypothetical protein [Thermoanaerobaculaceae bacterium]